MKRVIVNLNSVDLDYRGRIGARQSLKKKILEKSFSQEYEIKKKSLESVDLTIYAGEILGVIGKNGSGKTSLLRVLGGILQPSSGSITTYGSVAPLIELTGGFNLELTARENIILFGVLLGHDQKKIERDLEKIALSGGIEKVIDLPLRIFSTGMLARLAFAVATYYPASLLLIDEVLSVGDIEFQKKSFSRIQELMDLGEASVLVSHDLIAIETLATRVLWLDEGKVKLCGQPEEVIDAYRNN